MAVNPSPFGPKPQFELSDGTPAVGNQLFFYVAGSVGTKQNTYTDSTGGSANTNPLVLNSLGMPTTQIWFTAGQSYKVVYAPSTDTDPPTSPIFTVDNLTGINDVTGAVSEWIAGPTPTYVSATQFTLVGDQTSTFQVGRRVKATVTAGTSYGTITASAFGVVTTVTVDTTNSNALDNGLSAVSYALLSSSNQSVPAALGTLVDALGSVRVGTAASLEASLSSANAPINLSLTATVGSNILTVAIKTRGGSDPTAARPVLIPFRSATSTTGDYTWRSLTAATSIATTVGGTFGVANSVAFRLWIVAFDDGGTVRLGLINCLTSVAGAGAGRDATVIFPLTQFGLASATQIGAGSTLSQTFYSSGAAVTTKAYTVLGYLTYESGLATAGTFGVATSRLDLFRAGMALPGQTVQVQRNQTGAVNTGATVLPGDDTIPQITEGDQYMTQAITPTSAANAIKTDVVFNGTNSAVGPFFFTAALFQDATANALASIQTTIGTADVMVFISFSNTILASTTSATTLRVRAGGAAAGTTTFNGRASGRLQGGVMASSLTCTEIMA